MRTLIFCSTRKECENLKLRLETKFAGIKAVTCYGKKPLKDGQWNKDNTVIVATVWYSLLRPS
jgi:superfamily II DNA helicase RecQ